MSSTLNCLPVVFQTRWNGQRRLNSRSEAEIKSALEADDDLDNAESIQLDRLPSGFSRPLTNLE